MPQLIHLDEGNRMLKIKVIRIGFLFAFFGFCVFSGTVRTQETQEKKECWNCESGGSTLYDDFTVPENWRASYKPKIKSSSDTIAAGGSITAWVDSTYLACPPYQWSVSGTGYSLDKSTTQNDLETVTLSSAAGT
jgi:hypothetical protein